MKLLEIINREAKITKNDIEESNKLTQQAFEYDSNQDSERFELFTKAVILNPNNANALIQLGLIYLNNDSNTGFRLIEMAFQTQPPISNNSHQAQWLLTLLGRYKYQNKSYKSALYYLELAANSLAVKDHTQAIQVATLVTGFPESISNAKEIIEHCHKKLDYLLKQPTLDISNVRDNNPYIFMILSAFNLEIYYETNICQLMEKYYQLTKKVFPELLYISPNIYLDDSFTKLNPKKYQIGIISAFFYPNNSVLADFQGVIDRLPSNLFDITYIYLNESNIPSSYLEGKEKVLIINNNKDWITQARQKIQKLNLDLLLYLDSTMSSFSQRLLFSKLAHVQAVSHGHPITSGIDKKIVDYYISWEAAELPYQESQTHYSETLLLLPGKYMHQYYQPRINSEGLSVITKQPFKDVKRTDFTNYVPSDGNWYVCMQKPFKRHPEFDSILADISRRDPKARIILHDENIPENQAIVLNRLKANQANMDRIHFIPSQPHHKLMALYNLSDVILDSYYAGGCTTTREALEIGGIVVTLPSKYLGSRWSLAYYQIIGVLDPIAISKDDYINKALEIATNKELRNSLKAKILSNINKLFRQDKAIESWTDAITTMINQKKITLQKTL